MWSGVANPHTSSSSRNRSPEAILDDRQPQRLEELAGCQAEVFVSAAKPTSRMARFLRENLVEWGAHQRPSESSQLRLAYTDPWRLLNFAFFTAHSSFGINVRTALPNLELFPRCPSKPSHLWKYVQSNGRWLCIRDRNANYCPAVRDVFRRSNCMPLRLFQFLPTSILW